MILVTGATGTIGSHLVTSLLSQGAHVRVLVRDPDKARAAFGERVDLVSGDLQDASSVSVALKGVDSVFLNSPSLEGFVEMQRTLIDAAAATGIGHLVRLSVAGAAPDSTTSSLGTDQGQPHRLVAGADRRRGLHLSRCRSCADR